MYLYDMIKSALEYIDEHCNEDLNCNVVAEKFAYSEYHFHRLFKYVANISVTDYIRNRRLFAAANKLLNGDDTILDICLSCGFDHQQTFDRVFKQKYGMSPKDFRIRNEYVDEPTPDKILRSFYYRLQEGGKSMLKPYIVEKGIMRLIGNRKQWGGDLTSEVGGGDYRDQILKLPNRVSKSELNIAIDFWHSSRGPTNKPGLSSMFFGVEVDSLVGLPYNLESHVIPATRWLYLPLRSDDPDVLSLAPEDKRDDFGHVIGYAFNWMRLWMKENGYERQDFPEDIEIWWGLDKGYEDRGGPQVTLATAIK